MAVLFLNILYSSNSAFLTRFRRFLTVRTIKYVSTCLRVGPTLPACSMHSVLCNVENIRAGLHCRGVASALCGQPELVTGPTMIGAEEMA